MEVDSIKAKIGLVFGLIAFILVVVCLIGTWYTMNIKTSAMGVTVEAGMDLGLGQWTNSTSGETESYADMPDSDFKSVMSTTQILTIIALVFTLLMFIFGILVAMGKLSGKIGGVMGILAVIFTLIAFVYFMATLPPAMEEEGTGISGFWGSESVSVMGFSMEMSWGPGYAWYLMIVAFLMALIGTIMLLTHKEAPAPMPVAPPPEGMYPPPEPMMEEPLPPEEPPAP